MFKANRESAWQTHVSVASIFLSTYRQSGRRTKISVSPARYSFLLVRKNRVGIASAFGIGSRWKRGQKNWCDRKIQRQGIEWKAHRRSIVGYSPNA